VTNHRKLRFDKPQRIGRPVRRLPSKDPVAGGQSKVAIEVDRHVPNADQGEDSDDGLEDAFHAT
jgi:hypothetical protein